MNIKKALFGAIAIFTLSACNNDSDSQPKEASSDQISSMGLTAVIRQPMAALSHDYAAVRKNQIQNADYHLSVSLDSQSEIFSGKVQIDFTLAANNTSPVTLDFDSGSVQEVKVNGQSATFEYKKWFVSLDSDLFVEGKNTIELRYERAYATDGSGLHRFKDPETNEVYIYSNFEPYNANRLFPHFDQPNIKARFTLDVTAPAHWQVISTMREEAISLVEGTDEAVKQWTFPQGPVMSSYIFSLHAGPYHIWEGQAGNIPLRLFSRQALAQYVKIDDWFTPTKQSFAFFQEYYDLDYPFIKYDQIIVPDFNAGAMENIGAVTFNESFVNRGEKTTAQRQSLAYVIAHEMAHMWFGDLVTMDWWNGLWLNESFATYMAYLQLAEASDFENTWNTFYSGTKQWAYATDQLVTTHAIELPVHSTAEATSNFDGITYGKGASVLKQLPHYLGEKQFRLGVSNYLKKYAYKNTSLRDFIDELGLAADRNMDEWTQQWLYETGLNSIQLSIECEADRVKVLQINQSAPPEWPTLREQKVQIGFYQVAKTGMQLENLIPVTYGGAVTRVDSASGLPCPDFAYPNVDDWGYVKVNFDTQSLQTLKKHINDFDSPLMRLMLWQNLWDGVKDSVIPLDDYVEFVTANISVEGDDKVLSQVTYSLRSAFSYLTMLEMSDKNIAFIRARLESFVWSQLKDARENSDAQKIWFATLVATTHTGEAVERLADILNGQVTIKGLAIDQDKRWKLIVKLSQYEYADSAKLLKAEKLQDSSDYGQNMAVAADVVRPDPAVKEQWLNTILSTPTSTAGDRYKLSTLRIAMGYLFPSNQRALMAEFKERLLDVVPTLNDTAQNGFLKAYGRSLAPMICSKENVMRLAQAKEKFDGLNPILAKAYKITHQEEERCVSIGDVMLNKPLPEKTLPEKVLPKQL